ncbi:MAG: hypothetical protein WD231_04155 [Candidatus Woykebacteria bacterium]
MGTDEPPQLSDEKSGVLIVELPEGTCAVRYFQAPLHPARVWSRVTLPDGRVATHYNLIDSRAEVEWRSKGLLSRFTEAAERGEEIIVVGREGAGLDGPHAIYTAPKQ